MTQVFNKYARRIQLHLKSLRKQLLHFSNEICKKYAKNNIWCIIFPQKKSKKDYLLLSFGCICSLHRKYSLDGKYKRHKTFPFYFLNPFWITLKHSWTRDIFLSNFSIKEIWWSEKENLKNVCSSHHQNIQPNTQRLQSTQVEDDKNWKSLVIGNLRV